MIILQIEVSVEDYIWEDWANDHNIDPDYPEEHDLVQFVDDELSIYADSVKWL